MKKSLSLLLIIVLFISMTSCKSPIKESDNNKLELEEIDNGVELDQGESDGIVEEGYYTSKEDVALYIYKFGTLPSNFITKKEAMDLGWDSKKGNLWEVSDKKSIGGDRFGNREGLLQTLKGRQYYECDINYEGGFRGPERLVYSNDGLIYYTGDHYKTFKLLYGVE